MFESIRSKMIKIYENEEFITIKSFIGKRKILKNDLRIINDDIFCNKKASINKYDNYQHKHYKQKVSVQGFHSTGSTAVVDILREFDNTTVFGAIELETCGDKYAKNQMLGSDGIELSFYNKLRLWEIFDVIEQYDEIKFDTYIKKLIYNATQSLPIIIKECKVSHDIIESFNNIILNIATIENCHINTNNSYLPISSIVAIESNIKNIQNNKYVFYKLNKNIDIKLVKLSIYNFIECIFRQINSKDFLILDQLLNLGNDHMNEYLDSGYKLELHKQFLGDIKQIVVFRDPRDQFMTNFLWSEQLRYDSIDRYFKNMDMFLERIKKYKQYHPDRLNLNFEFLINDYENSIDKICNFLDIDKSHHVNKFRHFRPEVSRKNIGIYKNFHDQSIMEEIYKNFKEYCYEG